MQYNIIGKILQLQPVNIGRQKVARHVATKQIIQEIAAWTSSDDADFQFYRTMISLMT